MKHNYCTVYSKSYLYMGLILYNSLLEYDQDFCLYFICMDDEGFSVMSQLKPDYIVLINLKEIESEDKELYASKNNRTEKEYSWTIKGSVLLYLFKRFKAIDHIIWLDGDLKLLSDPQPIFDMLNKYSILLTEEKYTGPYEYLSKIYGVYQLGFIGFKRDDASFECLNWYREKLLEWCHEKPEEGKWSDQMYAVDWPERFRDVGIIENIGVNLTPFIAYRLHQEGKGLIRKHDEDIFIDDSKIILFHFYAFKYYDGKEFDLCLHWMKFTDNAIKLLYLDYINDAIEAVKSIRSISPGYYLDSDKIGKYMRNYFNLQTVSTNNMYFFCTIIENKNIINFLAMYESLCKFIIRFTLWVCCIDEKSCFILKGIKLPNIVVLDINNLESSEMSNIKNSCKREQYRNLLKVSISYFILKNNFTVEKLLYLNPEAYFFSHPAILFEAWREGCVFIHSFRFGKEIKKVSEIFNSGLIGFLRKEGALYFLDDYMKDCISFNNQKLNSKYCDFDMPLADYYGIRVISNLAADIDIFLLKPLKSDIKKPLICFNFKDSKALRILDNILKKSKGTFARNHIVKRIYRTYTRSLKKAYKKIKRIK